jgi:SAM-dependent methyltransferase
MTMFILTSRHAWPGRAYGASWTWAGERAPGAAAARPVHELPAHRSVTGHAGPGAPPCGAADGSRLPVADASVDAVAALYTLYHYADPRVPIREARRVLRPGGLLAACAPNRDSNPELAPVLPHWGAHSTFDGEDAAAIVTSIFGAQVTRWKWNGGTAT